MQTICASAFDHEITLWWEKPEDAAADTRYRLTVNGEAAGETCKTHFSREGVAADTVYAVRVDMVTGKHVRPLGEAMIRTGAEKRRIDVTRPPYSACNDGTVKVTAALQQAIDDCGPGDMVYLPAGVYLTGALRLHSDMELYIAENAVLQGSDDPADYEPRIWSRFEGKEQLCYASLLNLGRLDHTAGCTSGRVIIRGKGAIDGNGKVLADRMIAREKELLRDYLAAHAELVASCEFDKTIPGRVRSRLINLSNAENVRVSGLELRNGACWNFHMIYCRNILCDRCTFISKGIWNGDGWDPDSSEHCTLFGAEFYTGDDGVAIKSGKNPEGNEINRPTRHIRVFDCFSHLGHGICIGSEMSGGVEDVAIWDCSLAGCTQGLEIKGTRKRGGYVRNVSVRDCVMPCVQIHAVLYNDDGVGAPHPPVFEDIRYENVTLTGRAVYADHDKPVPPVTISGFDEADYAVRRVTLRNVASAGGRGDWRIDRCRELCLENVQFADE